MRSEWSWRGSTTMYVVVGMWQATQEAPVLPFRVVSGARGSSNFAGWWQASRRRRPAARNLSECGSWQSEQVTPAAYIRLCRKEPQL